MTQVGKLPYGPDQFSLAEFIPRQGTKFTSYHMFAGPGVSGDDYLVDGGYLPLVDSHLEVDGVIFHAHLHGCQLEKQVAVVQVYPVHRILVNKKPVIQHLLVKHIPLLDAQHRSQEFGRVLGIPDPLHITEVVFVPLLQVDIKINPVFLIRRER